MPFEVQHQVDLPTDTLLRAKLKDLTVREIPKRDGSGTFEKLKWAFEITQQGDYLGREVTAETSAFLSDSPYNQFRNWAIALLQRDITTGQVLSEGDLIGLPCDITVRYEEDRKDKNRKWARVEDVFSIDAADGLDDLPF